MNKFLSSFQEELTDFLAMREKTVGAETYAGDCRVLRSFDQFFTAYGCTEKSVSEDVVNAWIQSLFASNARKTVADKVGYLRNFLKYLQYCGIPVFIPRVPKAAESYIPLSSQRMKWNGYLLRLTHFPCRKGQTPILCFGWNSP